jgi:hypothetical protein
MIHKACSKLYRDTERQTAKSIMIAGTARSGTTWLADIIASQFPCRIMFEPFHSQLVLDFQGFHTFHYMRPAEPNSELLSYCRKIFTGDMRHPWIDRQVEHLFPRYRLIKEIRANLFLKWIHNAFPEIPLLLLIRHPCAVVLSRMRLGWATDTDIDSFLRQNKLVDDFLAAQTDLVRGAKTIAEKHAVIWCVHNLVPLKQFGPQGLGIVFYENLCSQPEIEIPKIFRLIRRDFKESVYQHLLNPSMTTSPAGPVVTGTNRIDRWQKELSVAEINDILYIVDAFGLGHLYGESLRPLARSFAAI